ncbi:MAG: hypothetical protein RLY86_2510 [Pseudomonadota bacterium]|jgi:CRISPR-associated protein Csx14
MAASTIPVDMRNPGQVFACLGLMEAAEILLGPATGSFGWQSERDTRASFTLEAPGDRPPVDHILRFLTQAEAVALRPASLPDLVAKEKGVPTEVYAPGTGSVDCYPCPIPDTSSALPTHLKGPGGTVPLSHWTDGAHIGRDNVKFWAGAGGYSGAALTRDALELLNGLSEAALTEAAAAPFDFARAQSSSFRFDWRRDYIPIDVGFSPNDHGDVRMVGYPLVEILAAVGLQHARPDRPDPRDKLTYRYGVWGTPLPTLLARAVLGGQSLGFPFRRFTMHLGWPGQEGQARCITDAQEDRIDD